jgi:hypothetical protein
VPEASAGFQSGRALSDYGPALYVRIGFDPGFRIGGPSPKLPPLDLPALVDTGASLSCIDVALAEQLQLPLVDRIPVIGVHGPEETNFYAAQIYNSGLKSGSYGLFAGLSLRSSGQLHYALIGRSFLERFTMTYEGRTGRVVISDV